jgi:hypothetical protein
MRKETRWGRRRQETQPKAFLIVPTHVVFRNLPQHNYYPQMKGRGKVLRVREKKGKHVIAEGGLVCPFPVSHKPWGPGRQTLPPASAT